MIDMYTNSTSLALQMTAPYTETVSGVGSMPTSAMRSEHVCTNLVEKLAI